MARIGQLTSQIVTGKCPECRTETLLVSFEPYLYRCVNCGYDLEQKVNGVIKYVVANEETRFQNHPLVKYDPESVNGGVQVLKLEYFEAKTTRAPVPRNQNVPKEAFGTLNGRSILVATSHAWFHQCHPDPEGVKLEIMRKDFFPRLRERFPHTEILVFDDWHSCPQWPRLTEEENARFRKCMEHMKLVYC